jgi:hypothetical protein
MKHDIPRLIENHEFYCDEIDFPLRSCAHMLQDLWKADPPLLKWIKRGTYMVLQTPENQMMSKVRASQRELPLAEWLAIPVWPNQRNTKSHGKKLISRKDFDPHHPSLGRHCGLVTVGGKTYKVNGITTTYLHTIGKCFYPKTVHAEHYYCDTMEEAQSVYNSFDPSWAGKGAKDRLVSAISNANITLRSALFANGKGTTGLSLSYNALRRLASTTAPSDIDGMIVTLRADMIAVDGLDLGGDIAGSSVVICAAILTHRMARKLPVVDDQRETALRDWKTFWLNFAKSRGQKFGAANDAHNVLWNQIAQGMKDSGGARGVAIPLIQTALYCYDRGINNRPINVVKVPKTLKLETYYQPKKNFDPVANGSSKSAGQPEARA